MLSTNSRLLQVSAGTLAQLVEQYLDSIGEIKASDHAKVELPWTNDLIPIKLTTFKPQEVQVIRHDG